MYALRPEGLREIDAWIDRYRRYWPEHLDALHRHLAQQEQQREPERETEPEPVPAPLPEGEQPR